jgi:6-phosphofructokinase
MHIHIFMCMYVSIGGTILASSRGGFDLNVIIHFLEKHKISHLYVIGGDGTHRGAFAISEEVETHVLIYTFVHLLMLMEV